MQPRTLLALVVVAGGLAALAAPACSSASTSTSPNVSGTYLVSVTNGSNGCLIAGVTEGVTALGVPLTVTQNTVTTQDMTVTLGGAPGALLNGVAGTTTLTGTLGNYQATLTPEAPDSGTVPSGMLDGCTYSATPSLVLNFAGDTVQGTMTYTLLTSGNNCTPLADCQTVQAFAGVLVPPPSDGGASEGDHG